ncbi:MAG: stage 0 sporulation family protein [Clostridia bacterium]|nr:stage 0 sporulation family protein [Clostridia bacterium]
MQDENKKSNPRTADKSAQGEQASGERKTHRGSRGGRGRGGRGRGGRGRNGQRKPRTDAPRSEIPEAPELQQTKAPAKEPETLVRPAEALATEVELSEQALRLLEDEETAARVQPPENPVEVIGVRFKTAGKVYYFDPCGIQAPKNSYVVVETARGTEFGQVALGNKIVDAAQIVPPLRPVLRAATAEDQAKNEENRRKEKEAFRICQEKIAEHGLEMKLVDVEYTFDRSKLLFYFTSEGRVDFRDLVKHLASIFRTRIELRQIGIRDEAKLMGGLGICGRPLCCASFLSDFVQVSIKMAKEQSLSLNSTKISGVCGRLMCCLRYESEVYEEELRRSPAVDAIVRTPDGTGVVTEVNPLVGTVRVRFPENTPPPKLYPRDEVKVIGRAGKGGRPDEIHEDA